MKPAAARVSRTATKTKKPEIIKKRPIKVPDAVLKRKITEHKDAIIGTAFKTRRGLKTLLGAPKEALGQHEGKHKKEQIKLVTLPLLTRPKKELKKYGRSGNAAH